ncbi:hypothetical protein CL654_00170 [bacterium]|nr:hypothetical protein [bacterium]|tara:strand:+ start:8313 stop:8645 length:333 start_codon:yes stop_codon:yes gene_type:complete
MKKIPRSITGAVLVVMYLLFVLNTVTCGEGLCGLLLPFPVLPFAIILGVNSSFLISTTWDKNGLPIDGPAFGYWIAVILISVVIYFIGVGIDKLILKIWNMIRRGEESQF